ncbi:MAG: hypothetical protein Q8865_01795 [Bacillota bacterium]|nr:hypothetical protein [Bacillota bacterium]
MLMKIFRFMWEKKWVITIGSLLFSVLFIAYACFNTYFTEHMIVSFIYPNSEKGYYPDGSRFNIYDLVSTEVLERAVKEYNAASGQKEISVDDVKKNISLTDYLAGSVQEKVTQARSLGQDYTYFTNEYIVSIRPTHVFDIHNKRKLFGLIPNINNKLFLDKLYESYSYYFMNEHTEMNIVPRITQNIQYDDYDYVEMADMFDKRANICINYLNSKNAENEAYRSSVTGMSFKDLITGFQSLRDVNIQNLKAFVSSSKISKNPVDLINKYKTQIEKLMLQYSKAKDEADISSTAMNQYDHTFDENIVITGINDQMGLYQARPKTAYDTVTKQALDAGVRASDIQKDIEDDQWQIQQYGDQSASGDDQKRLFSTADNMITGIEKESQRLITLANNTVDDYLSYKSSDYVRKTHMGKSYISMSVLMKTLIVFIISALAISLFLYLFLPARKEFYDRKEFYREKARAYSQTLK